MPHREGPRHLQESELSMRSFVAGVLRPRSGRTPVRTLVVLALAAGLILAPTGVPGIGAAPRGDREHNSGSDTFPDNICGIDGTSTVSFVDNFQEFADNTFKDQFEA